MSASDTASLKGSAFVEVDIAEDGKAVERTSAGMSGRDARIYVPFGRRSQRRHDVH